MKNEKQYLNFIFYHLLFSEINLEKKKNSPKLSPISSVEVSSMGKSFGYIHWGSLELGFAMARSCYFFVQTNLPTLCKNSTRLLMQLILSINWKHIFTFPYFDPTGAERKYWWCKNLLVVFYNSWAIVSYPLFIFFFNVVSFPLLLQKRLRTVELSKINAYCHYHFVPACHDYVRYLMINSSHMIKYFDFVKK